MLLCLLFVVIQLSQDAIIFTQAFCEIRHTLKGRWQKGQFLSQDSIPGGKITVLQLSGRQRNMSQRNFMPLRMFAVSCLFLRSTAYRSSRQMIVVASIASLVEKLQISV